MIPEHHKNSFETLKAAFTNGDAALVDCQDAATGEQVLAVCAVGYENDEYHIVPLAKMFNGSPYEELLPPSSNGGYVRESEQRYSVQGSQCFCLRDL